MTSGGLVAVSSSAFAALYSAFGKYDVVHIHAEGPAFFAWLPKMFGKRVVVTVHGECEIIWTTTDHFGLEKDSYILFLGRLVPEKGIRYLVEAFKNVKTDKKLVIAGGSSDTDSFMEELKELAKPNISLMRDVSLMSRLQLRAICLMLRVPAFWTSSLAA